MYKCIIFDLDGTIAYTLEDLKEAMNMMLSDFSWDNVSLDDVLEAINHGTRNFVRGCMPKEHRDNDELVDKATEIYFGYYKKTLLNTTKPYPDIIKALDYFKGRGIKMAVFSNKHDDNTKVICEKLFNGYFDIVMGGSNGRFEHKPSPDGAVYIAEQLGAERDEVLFIGDSDVDMKTAINAKMHPIGVSWGYRPASLLTELGAEKIVTCYDDFVSLVE